MHTHMEAPKSRGRLHTRAAPNGRHRVSWLYNTDSRNKLPDESTSEGGGQNL